MHTCNSSSFELLSVNKNCGCGTSCSDVVCHAPNKFSITIYKPNTFGLGAPVSYNSSTKAWSVATPGNCDFIVVDTDVNGEWFDVANTGVFDINRYDLMGKIYLNDDSNLTTEETSQYIGFSYMGTIALNIGMISNTPITPSVNGFMSFDSSDSSGYISLLGGF